MVSSARAMMIMVLMICASLVFSSHDDWIKVHASDPTSPIVLLFGVKSQVVGVEAGSDNAAELAHGWLLENGVSASEFISVEPTFIEVGIPIAVAESLLGVKYYDYQNGHVMIHRIEGSEFAIPQSAVHFLDFVWPTVLGEEEDIMEEVAWEEGEGQEAEAEAEEEEGGYYYRRLLDTDGCATGYYAQSGDIPGRGIVDGAGYSQQVSNCDECGKLCSDRANCLSYECSPTELKCNLNTVANPTAGPYKDYAFCTKQICATGYHAQIGDIPGNGIGGLQEVSHCNQCGGLCWRHDNCLSYECSPTELKCNLNTVANPTAGAYKDYAFCTKQACPYWYHEQIGDIPGWGTVLGVGGGQQVSNCNECAQLCSAGYKKNIALSYECSPTELKCNCNTGANPTAPAYKDYVFCTKRNIRTEGSCSKSITATSEEHCGETWEDYCEGGYFEEEGKCRKWVFLPFPVKAYGDMLQRLIPRTCTFKIERIDCPCCSRASEPCNCPSEALIRNTVNPLLRQCHHYFEKQTCASTDTDWFDSQLSDFLQSSGKSDYLQLEYEMKPKDNFYELNFKDTSTKIIISVVIVWIICAPLAMAYVAIKCCAKTRGEKYSKVETVSSGAEDMELMEAIE